jgi:hypothetical protein
MKKLVSLFFVVLFCTTLYADEIPIEPIPGKNGEKKHDRETIVFVFLKA